VLTLCNDGNVYCGITTFNWAEPKVRELWIDTVVNATKHNVDGIFADHSGTWGNGVNIGTVKNGQLPNQLCNGKGKGRLCYNFTKVRMVPSPPLPLLLTPPLLPLLLLLLLLTPTPTPPLLLLTPPFSPLSTGLHPQLQLLARLGHELYARPALQKHGRPSDSGALRPDGSGGRLLLRLDHRRADEGLPVGGT